MFDGLYKVCLLHWRTDRQTDIGYIYVISAVEIVVDRSSVYLDYYLIKEEFPYTINTVKYMRI